MKAVKIVGCTCTYCMGKMWHLKKLYNNEFAVNGKNIKHSVNIGLKND